MDYQKSAQEVIEHIGGKENIVSAAHCATRLRLVISDNSKCQKEAIENVDGVKGVFEAAGQLQIIFGTGTVNKVYDEFIRIAGITESTKEEVKQAAAQKQNILKRAVKTLGDIFVPIIPAIVASGLLMGLLEGFAHIWPQMSQSGTYQVIHLFSNAAFVFLPILIAISASKTFGGNQFLGAVIGMIMIHPDLVNAWSVSGMKAADIPHANVWFGLYDVNLVGYQGHVIPVIIAVWLMCTIEKKLHKIVPEMIDLFVTPLVTVLVTGYVTLTIIGPIFSVLENYVLAGAKDLITLPFGIGGLIIGIFYAPTVVAGLHHMYNALEAGLLSSYGYNTWMPIATAANVAQGAAALAVAFKTKNKKRKAVAFPAALSAFLGITEPAIFGINIRFMRPFIAGIIGGACGGLVAGLLKIKASAYGITGVFGFLITTSNTLGYAVIILVASGVAFVASWILYKENDEQVPIVVDQNKTDILQKSISFLVEKMTVHSPLNGKAIELSEVNDATFAGEVLGKGFAVVPTVGEVYAPFDGVVETVFETKHAIGLKSNEGIEILIHIGLNTVELNGKHFQTFVKEGDTIHAGDALISFDMEGIKEAGYDITTPVIVTNIDDYSDISKLLNGEVKVGNPVLKLK